MMKDMHYIMVLLLELILFPVWQTFKYVKYPYFQNRCFYNTLQVFGYKWEGCDATSFCSVDSVYRVDTHRLINQTISTLYYYDYYLRVKAVKSYTFSLQYNFESWKVETARRLLFQVCAIYVFYAID